MKSREKRRSEVVQLIHPTPGRGINGREAGSEGIHRKRSRASKKKEREREKRFRNYTLLACIFVFKHTSTFFFFLAAHATGKGARLQAVPRRPRAVGPQREKNKQPPLCLVQLDKWTIESGGQQQRKHTVCSAGEKPYYHCHQCQTPCFPLWRRTRLIGRIMGAFKGPILEQFYY